MKTKQVVNVEQIRNRAMGQNVPDQYVYRVVSLKNILTPAIGDTIKPAEVERLIKEGVDVNISPLK
jgi:hypothetical protein